MLYLCFKTLNFKNLVELRYAFEISYHRNQKSNNEMQHSKMQIDLTNILPTIEAETIKRIKNKRQYLLSKFTIGKSHI